MARPKFQDAIDWIAFNDNNGSDGRLDIDEISSYISVLLVADVWGFPPSLVARKVIAVRKEQDRMKRDLRLLRSGAKITFTEVK